MPEDAAKAKSRSISLNPDEWTQVDAIVEREYGGNRSRYFQALHQREINRRKAAGEYTGGEETVVAESAGAYAAKENLMARVEEMFAQLLKNTSPKQPAHEPFKAIKPRNQSGSRSQAG